MIQDYLSGTPLSHVDQDVDLLRLRDAGRHLAMSFPVQPPVRALRAKLDKKASQARQAINDGIRQNSLQGQDSRWLTDNYRLITAAQKEARQFAASYKDYRATAGESVDPVPYAVASAYIAAAAGFFSTEGLRAFLSGFHEEQRLEMSELWALKPALQLVLTEEIARVVSSTGHSLAVLVTSLRNVGEGDWKELFESASVVHEILSSDPAHYYRKMDYDSRDHYRTVLTGFAKHSDLTEVEIARTCVNLAAQATVPRQRHIGYWLLDDGVPVLRAAIGYRPPRKQRVRDLMFSWPTAYYLIGIEVLTLLLAFTIVDNSGNNTPTVLALFLLIIPLTQAAVDFMNNLTSYMLKPRFLPKLDFSDGVPEDCATMVAVPTLLLSDKQVRQLITDIEIRYLANRNSNLYFALVTDGPDADQQEDERDHLVDVCAALIDDLNARYGYEGKTPFYLFHRHRTFNPSEGRWMGWERKRGKLLDLNQLMRGGFDSFPVKIGNLDVLPKIRYVITLDSDTQLPRDAAQKLIGTIAHPLHKAVVHPVTKMVVAGYGILQPRIGISIDSASSSRLASIYSGQTGFDIYTRAVSDVYQDLFGEGIFTGKGIYDVDALRDAIEHRFPENALLSHDLIEGAYARVGLVSDIELIDDYPSHFSAYSRRKHRWVRGDWQITRWLLPKVPDFQGRIISNPMNRISRWKILDNLRRSLWEPATLALFIGGWLFLRGKPLYWTCISILMLLMPVYAGLFFSLIRIPLRSPVLPAWIRDTAAAFIQGHVVAFLQITFLLHQSLLSLDAIVRSVARVFVYKKRLLEWETAAEAESAKRRTATVDIYLAWSPLLALLIGVIVWLVRPQALPVAAPIIGLWFIARFLSAWLNRAPRTARGRLDNSDLEFLRHTAARTWRYFHQWSGADNNWFIPDNVREDGTVAGILSPTNLGLLLNARIAAVHFGYLTLTEFAEKTIATLDQFDRLPKYRGHLLNWYDIRTHSVLEPRFVSTVDSGNLAACLWTLRQAALSFISNPPSAETLKHGLVDITACWPEEVHARTEALSANTAVTEELKASLQSIAERCDVLVEDMDFSFLYNRRKKVLSVGCDVDTGIIEPAAYDLLASESRIASFIAVAKGDIPQEGWFHLGRRHTIFAGNRVLVSWTGTMFEYLMPALWMRHSRNTLLQKSAEAVVRVQQKVAHRKGIPWGISESACTGSGCDYGYHAFGIPELAMKVPEQESTVISPYSTFLALQVDPAAALKNLRRMATLGWVGDYGFYEAVDYSNGQPNVIRSWMAHHQGMSLLAICNLLFADTMQQYFHAEPQVLATELLLHERVPNAIPVDKEPAAPPHLATEASTA